ncbi:hypothetical protein [Streptomyces acidicola]
MTDSTLDQVWKDFIKVGPSDNRAARALWRRQMARWSPRFPGTSTLVE